MKFWAVIFGCLASWCSFWLMIGCFHGYQQFRAEEQWMKANAAKDMQDLAFWNEMSHEHASWITSALMNGLIWPIPVMISIVLGWFVFRRLNARFGN